MNLNFPKDKKKIARLSMADKFAWYQLQFEKDPRKAVVTFSTPEFQKFWMWRVAIPMRILRFYYRIKNGELWKRYPHISDLRKNGHVKA